MLEAWSRTRDGTRKLSANFTVAEFACKDGSDPVFVDSSLAALLQKIRDHFGRPVVITSGGAVAAGDGDRLAEVLPDGLQQHHEGLVDHDSVAAVPAPELPYAEGRRQLFSAVFGQGILFDCHFVTSFLFRQVLLFLRPSRILRICRLRPAACQYRQGIWRFFQVSR